MHEDYDVFRFLRSTTVKWFLGGNVQEGSQSWVPVPAASESAESRVSLGLDGRLTLCAGPLDDLDLAQLPTLGGSSSSVAPT